MKLTEIRGEQNWSFMSFGRIHGQVKIPSAEVHVEWLKSSLLADETEGCGNCIKLENYEKE